MRKYVVTKAIKILLEATVPTTTVGMVMLWA